MPVFLTKTRKRACLLYFVAKMRMLCTQWLDSGEHRKTLKPEKMPVFYSKTLICYGLMVRRKAYSICTHT